MRLPWQRRDGDVDATTPPGHVPSEASTGRLADRLHRELEDLRSGLTDDLLLTLMLIGEDEVDEAVGVLDDGSERLQRFQDRVEDAVADAAVERDAEAVLAGAFVPEGEGRNDPMREAGATRVTAFRIRALASVAAAALAAVVAVVSVEPSDAPELVAARASSQATAAPATPGSSVDPATGLPDATGSGSGGTVPTERAVTPGDRLEALRLIGDRGAILARLGSEPRRSAVAALFGVERLIGTVVADAGDVLPSETVDAVEETLSELELPPDEASSESTSEDAPAEEPAEEPTAPEPTATEEPTEEPSTEDGSEDPDDDPDDGSSDGTSDDTTGSFPGTDTDATAIDGSGLL